MIGSIQAFQSVYARLLTAEAPQLMISGFQLIPGRVSIIWLLDLEI